MRSQAVRAPDLGLGSAGGGGGPSAAVRSLQWRDGVLHAPSWRASSSRLSVLLVVGELLPTPRAPVARSWTGRCRCQAKLWGFPPSTYTTPITDSPLRLPLPHFSLPLSLLPLYTISIAKIRACLFVSQVTRPHAGAGSRSVLEQMQKQQELPG